MKLSRRKRAHLISFFILEEPRLVYRETSYFTPGTRRAVPLRFRFSRFVPLELNLGRCANLRWIGTPLTYLMLHASDFRHTYNHNSKAQPQGCGETRLLFRVFRKELHMIRRVCLASLDMFILVIYPGSVAKSCDAAHYPFNFRFLVTQRTTRQSFGSSHTWMRCCFAIEAASRTRNLVVLPNCGSSLAFFCLIRGYLPRDQLTTSTSNRWLFCVDIAIKRNKLTQS